MHLFVWPVCLQANYTGISGQLPTPRELGEESPDPDHDDIPEDDDNPQTPTGSDNEVSACVHRVQQNLFVLLPQLVTVSWLGFHS